MPEEPAAETKEVDQLDTKDSSLVRNYLKPLYHSSILALLRKDTKETPLPEVTPVKDTSANVNEPKKVPPRPEFAKKVGFAVSETTVPVTAK